MKAVGRRGDESGMALVTTMMVLMLASALMIGFFAAIVADQKANGIDRDQSQAYAAAHAGLEKLTSDLATLFETDFNPTAAKINTLATYAPAIPGFNFIAPGGAAGSGYTITFTSDANGNPAPVSTTGTPITTGPYQGFNGIITQYTLTSTARSSGNAEVRLRRTLETVSVPVFQFGVFSETDLSFFAGPNFNFGGRIHTNGNLYLEEGAGNTLTLSDKVTVGCTLDPVTRLCTVGSGEVIRRELSNGYSTRVYSPNYTGTVKVLTAPGVFRALGLDEGSLKDSIGAPISAYPLLLNELPSYNPGWTSISTGTYKSNIINKRTGGKNLSLPLVSQGAQPIDLIRRAPQGEDPTGLIFPQRYFAMASLRILLSDTAADITTLPTVTATAPVPLDGTATLAQYLGAAGNNNPAYPPLATSPGPQAVTTNGITAAGSTTISVNGGIPSFFRADTLTVNGTLLGSKCDGRDATHFTGCPPLPAAAPNNSPVTASVKSGAGTITVQTTLNGAHAANSTTLTVASTGAFAPGLFWANVAGATPLAITCTGNNTGQDQFTGCTGITSTIPNGTTLTTNALSAEGTPLLGGEVANDHRGYIKIELQNNAGGWVDVTTEILNLGIASRDQLTAACADPNTNAVIRLQRLRDSVNGNCYYLNSLNSNDYWPNALYDTREGNVRDANATTSATVTPAGAMSYVALDVGNLKRWLAGTIGVNGPNVKNQNGFIVYFSDRRNNRNTGVVNPAVETGEYGFEDVINPTDINGAPDGALDVANAEDVNASAALDTYGQMPVNVPPGAALPLTAAARSWNTTVGGTAVTGPALMVNRPIFFRRALKLVNGGIVANVSNLPAPGLTVASENPMYIHGSYNASSNNPNWSNDPHVAASVLADAITMLSNDWKDISSFLSPNNTGQRKLPANSPTSYRVAIAAGKTRSFVRPTWAGAAGDFGTDGGVHNFLRYLEHWNGNNLNYRGSIVSLYMSRQAIGTYKCCANVYSPPVRNYTFDTDFLQPNLLPPGTPMFRDVDTLTFRQLLRPTQ